MDYRSTRNENLRATAAEAILQGLAPDGGLYSMDSLSGLNFDWRAVLDCDTLTTAREVLTALLPDFSREEMEAMLHDAYDGKFETEELTLTVAVGEDGISLFAQRARAGRADAAGSARDERDFLGHVFLSLTKLPRGHKIEDEEHSKQECRWNEKRLCLTASWDAQRTESSGLI